MLISNPVHSPYFLPTLWISGGILGGTLLLLLLLVRFDPRKLPGNVLFERWRVWATIAPIYALAILSGQITTLLLLSFLVFQGLREYARLVALPASYTAVLLVTGLLASPVALTSLETFQLLPFVLFILGTLQPLLLPGPAGVRSLAFAALGWGYIAWFLAHLMLLDKYVPGGQGVLLAIGLGVALSDVGAFTVGKLLGRHKLAPRLSPNKTWEGVIGNFLGAYLGVGIMAFALPGGLRWALVAVLSPLIAVGSLWGDLLESSIKREFQVKDAGSWLPGFGGLLDRVDSLIMVGPLVFYFLRIMG